MMRPENKHNTDTIGTLLNRAWEDPPAQLMDQLISIPAQVDLQRSRRIEKFTFLLNSILVLWGIGTILFFWTPIEDAVITLSRSVLNWSGISNALVEQPVMGLTALAFLLVGWVWMDMEKHPKTM